MFKRFSNKTAEDQTTVTNASSVTTTTPILQCARDISLPQDYPLHDLDADKLDMLKEFRTAVESFFLKEASVERLREEAWCDDACLLRYLRATKYNLCEAGIEIINYFKRKSVS